MPDEPGPDPDVLALVAAAVAEVNGEPVGPHTGFFEAGLTSVALVRLHDRLRERLGRDLPVWAPFRYPTVAALARYLGAPPGAEPDPAAGTDRRVPPAAPALASPPAGGPEARRRLRAAIREGKG